MKSKIEKNIRLLFISFVFITSLITVVSCDSYEDEPPLGNQISVVEKYVIPPGKQLTNAEREIIDERNREYKIALGIKN